ncbi:MULTISPECIES: hypothetical protein [Ureibacillus]|uniref:Uncharacterized protein n=1 Tax=Ureibacillus thermosphaericus TaxID=51173 RepID=A0A840PX15_URETH|nr:hypothetical protein [Ureibacillus thermosphaericus]MBB5150410.1 hypothetical protein [Ureibacillus thermosphaericus]NKZ32996.1 hypothetical protein [Ureibacillus thermosphaericus]
MVTKLKNKLEAGLMGASLIASIIGIILIISFTIRFLTKEWNNIITFFVKIF